jgi:hypothetical protein
MTDVITEGRNHLSVVVPPSVLFPHPHLKFSIPRAAELKMEEEAVLSSAFSAKTISDAILSP